MILLPYVRLDPQDREKLGSQSHRQFPAAEDWNGVSLAARIPIQIRSKLEILMGLASSSEGRLLILVHRQCIVSA